jgi:hypothetical protein
MFDNFDESFNKGDENNENLQKFIKTLMNMRESLKNDDESELGEPKLVSRYEDGGYTFERTEWENEHGTIVKIEMVGSPLETSGIKKELPLQKQLELAVTEERYEDAARIRDEINKKTFINDLTDNQNINSKDEWNF